MRHVTNTGRLRFCWSTEAQSVCVYVCVRVCVDMCVCVCVVWDVLVRHIEVCVCVCVCCHTHIISTRYITHDCFRFIVFASHITHMNESYHTHEWVISHTWMSHITHTNQSYHTSWRARWQHRLGLFIHIWMRHVTTEWRKCTRCVELQVSCSCRSLSAKAPLLIGRFCEK